MPKITEFDQDAAIGGAEKFYVVDGSTDKYATTSQVRDYILPTGMMAPYAGASAPSGWLLCDGTAVSRTTYSDLYTLIGTTYGIGDGVTTFNLPDFSGRVPVGVGTGTDDNANNDTFALGGTEGEYTHTLTESEMPAHTHNWDGPDGGAGAISHNGASGINRHDSDDSVATTSTGGGSAHNNIQPVLAINFIIKF